MGQSLSWGFDRLKPQFVFRELRRFFIFSISIWASHRLDEMSFPKDGFVDKPAGFQPENDRFFIRFAKATGIDPPPSRLFR